MRALPGLLLLLGAVQAAAAPLTPTAMPEGSSPSAGAIVRPEALAPFFLALKALDAQLAGPLKVDVLHVGDSHLQSDLLSHPLRQDLQRRFGDAGRGLVFPYEVAHTNDAQDLLDESNVVWVARRCAAAPPKGFEELNTGVAGYSLLTRAQGYVLKVGLRGHETFDRVTVFRRRANDTPPLAISAHRDPYILERAGLVPRDEIHTVSAGETLYRIAARFRTTVPQLMKWNRLQNNSIWPGDTLIVSRRREPSVTGVQPAGFWDLAQLPGGSADSISETVDLPSAQNMIFLRGVTEDAQDDDSDAEDGPDAHDTVLDGLYLERAAGRGVVYSAAGVNGAEAAHFAAQPRFLSQAAALRPQLLILSFGTNESDGGSADIARMRRCLAGIVRGIVKDPSIQAVLVTTPPDSLGWNGHFNPHAAEAAEALRAEAALHGWALFDFNAVMGGAGTAERWRNAGLMDHDAVHMTAAGYRLQEQLLFRALMDAYDRF